LALQLEISPLFGIESSEFRSQSRKLDSWFPRLQFCDLPLASLALRKKWFTGVDTSSRLSKILCFRHISAFGLGLAQVRWKNRGLSLRRRVAALWQFGE
jgi:hypothetical protein